MSNHGIEGERAKAIVVGAGPVGAALALSLARIDESLDVLLLDAASGAPTYNPDIPDTRVFAINEGSRQVLDQLGVWPAISAHRCQAYQRMYVWDAEGTGNIEFDALEFESKSLGHIVEANLIQAQLFDAAEKFPNLHIFGDTRVSAITKEDDGIRLETDAGERYSAELVCAADGARSSLRELMGIDVAAQETGQRAIVANIYQELPNQSCAWQIFLPTGPLAFLPMQNLNGRYLSSIVWSVDDDEAERLNALDDQEFEKALARAIEYRFGELGLASSRQSIPLAQRHARQYVSDSFALVGDAAHSIHPLAGLGANLGFQDVAVLSAELKRAFERGICWGDLGVLKRYQRQRVLENELALRAMQGFKTLFGNTNLSVAALRNLGLRAANSSSRLKQTIVRRAMMS